MSHLAILTMYENPLHWQSRRRNFYRFASELSKQEDCTLFVIEVVHGIDRPELESDQFLRMEVRTESLIWHKENALDVLLNTLPNWIDTIAWVDADVSFTNPRWVDDTMDRLGDHAIVQLFSHTQDLDSNYEAVEMRRPGYYYQYVKGGRDSSERNLRVIKEFFLAVPGLGWAARREEWDKLGFIDWAILGSADYHMASALLGQVGVSLPMDLVTYREKAFAWQEKALQVTQKNVGYVPGLLLHHWHGPRDHRGYNTRWDVLVNHSYDPNVHLHRNPQGIYELVNNPGLVEDVMLHLKHRNEDTPSDVRY